MLPRFSNIHSFSTQLLPCFLYSRVQSLCLISVPPHCQKTLVLPVSLSRRKTAAGLMPYQDQEQGSCWSLSSSFITSFWLSPECVVIQGGEKQNCGTSNSSQLYSLPRVNGMLSLDILTLIFILFV